MDPYLFDPDEFLGEHVIITSFSGTRMEGILTDADDSYLELKVDDEFIQIPIEPVRNVIKVEE